MDERSTGRPGRDAAAYTPLRVLANRLVALLGATAVAETALSSWLMFDENLDDQTENRWLLITATTTLIILVATATTYARWFYLAYRNLAAFGHRRQHAQWWAFWGWILPIFSLFRPYQITVEIWRASLPEDIERPAWEAENSLKPTPQFIKWWWGFHLAAAMLTRFSQTQPDVFGGPALSFVLVTGVVVVAAFFAMNVVLIITALQERRSMELRGRTP